MERLQPEPTPGDADAHRRSTDASRLEKRSRLARRSAEVNRILVSELASPCWCGRSARLSGCSGRGSNPHGILSQGILSPSRLPVSPPERRTTSQKRNEAGNGTRTRDPNLGKVVLYQLSYSRNDRQSYRQKMALTSAAPSMDATPNLKLTKPRAE